MTGIDSQQFKEAQRKSWDSAAPGWQECWKTFENGAQRVSDHLVELAKINPNSRVLDIATGIGEPAITAAKKIHIGNGHGYVLAMDMSSQMLSIARQRASSLDLQQVIEFLDGDAETISLPASTFDAVLCRWGCFYPILERAYQIFTDQWLKAVDWQLLFGLHQRRLLSFL